MHRIDTKTAQKDKFGAGKNGFTRGNPQTGTPATDLDDDYFDMLQEELCSVVEASGASLEKGRHDQLLTALRALLLSRKNPFGDIKSDGTVKTALENLGLNETINLAKNAVPATRRVNSKPLTGDITLWASDVGAISADAVGKITDNGTMASANTPGWWRVEVSNSDTVADFPTYPDGSKLYSYGYLFVEKIGEVWFQHYYAHMGANAKRQDWGTVPNTSRPWIVDYNTANKPTANDVQALPIAGGRLNGPLSIGTDNALGGNSIVLGDNDTGFKQNGDGVLDVYSNSTHVLRFIGNLVESMVSLKVNGNAVATGEVQAGNGTSRMVGNGDIFGNVWNGWLSTHLNNLVADVQLGAGTSVATWNNAGSWPNTPGYVVTSVWKDATDTNIDGIVYAPLQKRLGIQWYTVQGGTA